MYTNQNNLPLPIAIWLATDTYEHDSREFAISATSLLKPTKSIVLGKRLEAEATDIMELVPSRFGTAVHDSIEMALKLHYKEAMTKLDIPQKVIDSVQINPDPEKVEEGSYVIRAEERHEKMLGKWIITGKYDLIEEGEVQDVKTTKTYNWIKGGNDEKYLLQGSIYRWLRPDLITKDTMTVHMIMTDWKDLEAMAKKEYPKYPIMPRKLPLKTFAQTEAFISHKLQELEDNWDRDQEEMPACTPEEVWQRPSTWAYYKNPKKMGRATKVFDSLVEAEQHRDQNGGVVVHRPGEVKFCLYCPASAGCLQAEDYRQQGLLK